MSEDIKIPQAKEFFKEMKVKQGVADIKLEFLSRIITIIIAGLGLVTALAWDEVLKDIYVYFKDHIHGVSEKLGYAIFVTIFSVIISVLITRFFIRKKKKVIEDEL